MRFKIKISKNTKTLPFDYQQKLVGTIHKWMGRNKEHGKQSVFSFSQLQNGEKVDNGFNFPDGSALYFSSTDKDILTNVYKGIKSDPNLFCGLIAVEINIINEPEFKNEERFVLLSPLLFKRKDEGRNSKKHFTFKDAETEGLLTEAVKKRLSKNGIEDDSLKITFDKTYLNKKTKVIKYKGIGNKTSVCPVIVIAKPESMSFIWNNGIGHSTGIGFGCLK